MKRNSRLYIVPVLTLVLIASALMKQKTLEPVPLKSAPEAPKSVSMSLPPADIKRHPPSTTDVKVVRDESQELENEIAAGEQYLVDENAIERLNQNSVDTWERKRYFETIERLASMRLKLTDLRIRELEASL